MGHIAHNLLGILKILITIYFIVFFAKDIPIKNLKDPGITQHGLGLGYLVTNTTNLTLLI
jgi:hypothetical protein